MKKNKTKQKHTNKETLSLPKTKTFSILTDSRFVTQNILTAEEYCSPGCNPGELGILNSL